MHNLFRVIGRELEELDEKAGREGKLTRADIEDGKNLAKFKMALLTCDEMEQGQESRDGYSGRRYRDDSRESRESSFDGSASGRRRDSMGRFRDGGASSEGYSGRRGYSREEAKEKLVSSLENMMDDVSMDAQHAISKAIRALERE